MPVFREHLGLNVSCINLMSLYCLKVMVAKILTEISKFQKKERYYRRIQISHQMPLAILDTKIVIYKHRQGGSIIRAIEILRLMF